MPSTTNGYPYPAATDPVKDGAAAIQALAEAVDTKLRRVAGRISGAGAIVSGAGFTVVRNSAGVYTVTFSAALAAIPVILVTIANEGGFLAPIVPTFSTTSFVVKIYNPSSAPTDAAFAFHAVIPS